MTDSQTPSIPTGWYPDPSNTAQQRWWDGTQWTEQVSAPYVLAEQPKAPEGTSGNTPWIWLNVFLPLLGLLPLFFIDFTTMFGDMFANPEDPSAVMDAQLAFFAQPAYLATIGLSFVIMAATILFAFLDWRELKRRGVPAPFHWAFSFLALAGFGVVYPIGRAVVAKRRTGSGNGVLLAAILVIALSIIVSIVWTVVLMNQMFALIGDMPVLR